MKQTLSTYQIAEELIKDDNANWSRSGAFALAEYLEELETDCGTEQELDVVAIRCEFSEFESLQEWASDYFTFDQLKEKFWESAADEDEFDEAIRDYIYDNGMLIEFDGGVIVSSF